MNLFNPKEEMIFKVDNSDIENNDYDSDSDDIYENFDPETVEWYDPEEDDKNEQWIRKKTHSTKDKKNTDAILTCPLCFTYLCFECQRHELYHNQYRAMFVRNCIVNKNERYRIPEENNNNKNKNRNKKKNKKNNNSIMEDKETKTEEQTNDNQEIVNNQDYYYPVLCQYCQTQVGLLDQNEIYHLFNVIPSDF
ncbi:hypothetical protein BCR32DRAFT_222250 [Anaeromyces robustus]|uniref:E2F-associated phosphoprotein n=1 Tax=Anaeromyces robustus TaxID=1754192 RepID=A0A1Y1WZC1_9FUNG|nr:hypothetical protein BCR32DRAFT_222250 [Anaeromyces robustus]|eukprot:ORX78937.1 hypothetical protein BCR32DRAFT_222250 [Anaeromyces robustus]